MEYQPNEIAELIEAVRQAHADYCRATDELVVAEQARNAARHVMNDAGNKWNSLSAKLQYAIIGPAEQERWQKSAGL